MTVQSLPYSETQTNRLWLMASAATIFIAAFLLFQIELLIAKLILPWFGGSAAVWLACLLFFQLALLGGYLYAHLVATRLSPLSQARIHSVLLIASLLFLPVIPGEMWKPSGAENPLPLILGLLASTIGLPFLLLSSSTPLLQAWIGRAVQSDTPALTANAKHPIYRLYALSNLGSMLGLFSYPILIEPAISTHLQARVWSIAYALFAALSVAAAWHQAGVPVATEARRTTSGTSPVTISERCFWVLLPAAASALLLAISNHILRNVAAMPLFWVVPLGLYLLSFIIAFDRSRWYWRPLWLALFAGGAAELSRILVGPIDPENLLLFLGLYTGGLFVFCMVCHGELARLKPAPQHLTAYYLSISAGGAAGGLFVAVLAPMLLSVDIDLALLLPATAALVIAVAWTTRRRSEDQNQRQLSLALLLGSIVMAGHFSLTMAAQERANLKAAAYVERNFYGPLRVDDFDGIRRLWNGNIVHGMEYLAPDMAAVPTSYYSHNSGVGMALTQLGEHGPLHVGGVGLGAGTIAAYARASDSYRFYEINPAVADIAKREFGFLDRCGAPCEVILGDGRLSLERDPPQQFDLLAVDAFSSDSIPAHLLTREAFALYWRHLKPGGVLAIHTSNKYVNLPPVIALAAAADGKIARSFFGAGDHGAISGSQWVLVTSDASFFEHPLMAGTKIAVPPGLQAWTDDYSNLWRSLR